MRRTLLVFLSVFLLVASGFSGATTFESTAGPLLNNVVIGSDQEPSNLNPWEGAADTKENVLALLFIGLTYVDQTGVLKPGLATEIPTEANGRLRINETGGNFVSQEVDWSIRDDATWSDGVDISCADVLFTHEVQSRNDLPLSTTAFSDLVDIVECTNGEDGNDFTITYNAPNLFFANVGGNVGLSRFYDIAPKHVWEQYTDNITDPTADFLGVPPATATDVSQVVGSGPFSMVVWNINQFMTLQRRDDFFFSPPGPSENYVDEVTIRFISDTPTILTALFAGELDATDDIALAGQDPAVVQSQLGNTAVVETTPSGFIEGLHFNLFADPDGMAGLFPDDVDCQSSDDLLLYDPRTRQAIIQAINRTALAPVVFPGAQPSNSFVVAGDSGFNSSLNTWEFDLDAAQALLSDLGWSDTDGDGFLERTTSDGREVQFDLPYVSTDADFRIQTGQILQQDLSDIGINLMVDNLPGGVVFATEFINHGSDCVWGGIFEFAEAGGIGQSPSDPNANMYFADNRLENPPDPEPDNIPYAGNDFAGTNITGWINAEFDQLRADALNEFDPTARAAIVEQMQVIWNEELPSVPLYDRTENVAIKVGLLNFRKGSPAARTQYVASWCWGWEDNGAVEAVC